MGVLVRLSGLPKTLVWHLMSPGAIMETALPSSAGSAAAMLRKETSTSWKESFMLNTGSGEVLIVKMIREREEEFCGLEFR